jgi:hypothetical protein
MTPAAPVEHSGIKDELTLRGFALLRDLSEDSAVDSVNGLGDVLLRTDICPKANARGDVSTDLPMDFHTDHPKARWIAWHCIRQSSEGGESLLVDSAPLIAQLTTHERDTLRNTQARTHLVFPADHPTHSVLIPVEEGADRIYFAPWLISDEASQPLCRLGSLIANAERISIRLKQGDLLVIDNARMLHGRKAIRGDRDRLLRRYWISQVVPSVTSIPISPQ